MSIKVNDSKTWSILDQSLKQFCFLFVCFDTLQFYILLLQPWFISKIDVLSSDETVRTIATLAYI